MYKILLAASLVGLASLSWADEPKKSDAKLVVGNPAPKLKADKWLQGSKVTSFAPGKVYVVEFWATWCGPCIAMMPHLAELQAEYRDKGVTFIGFSSRDPGPNPDNNLDSVSALVKKRGAKLGYTFAYADNRETWDNWMTAAKEDGIPTSFVVDKKGKIAYIGHPMVLDFVLPKVVAGTWKPSDMKSVKELDKQIDEVVAAVSKDPDTFLKALDALSARHPWAAKNPYFVRMRITKLAVAKKTDEAAKLAREVLARAIEVDDSSMLNLLAFSLRELKNNKEMMSLAVQAAEANLKVLGESDFGALRTAMGTLFAAGDAAKASAYATKAVAAAKTPAFLSTLFNQPAVKDDKKVMEEMLKAAEKQVQDKVEPADLALMNVADAFFILGNKEKAREFGDKAIEAAKTPDRKANFKKHAAKFGEKRKRATNKAQLSIPRISGQRAAWDEDQGELGLPGWVKTELGGSAAPLDLSEGGQTSVQLATLPDDGPTGGYFHLEEPLPW